MGGKGQDFRENVAWLEARGWEVDADRNGYPLARCPCGEHLKTIHRTPSNPQYWKNLRKHVERLCQGGSV